MYEQHFPQLQLAVCDDEPAFCAQLAERTRELLRPEQLEAEIHRFESTRALLETMRLHLQPCFLVLQVFSASVRYCQHSILCIHAA